MESKFKKGIPVYDEISHPGETLTVKEIYPDIGEILVEDNFGFTEIYNMGGYILKEDNYGVFETITNRPTLSIEPYTLQGFK
jgi:hypothetical protein